MLLVHVVAQVQVARHSGSRHFGSRRGAKQIPRVSAPHFSELFALWAVPLSRETNPRGIMASPGKKAFLPTVSACAPLECGRAGESCEAIAKNQPFQLGRTTMKKLALLMLVLSMIAVSASQAMAQRGGRGGGGRGPGGNSFSLLNQKSIQDELKLTDEQIKKAEQEAEKQRDSFAGFRDLSPEERQGKIQERLKVNQAALAEILKEDQLKRFKQIEFQQRGSQALADPEVAQALALTTEQKDRIQAIQEASRNEMRELFQAEGGREKIEALRASVNEKANAVLTPEQQTKWKEMTGSPFKGEIRRPGRGGNRSVRMPVRGLTAT